MSGLRTCVVSCAVLSLGVPACNGDDVSAITGSGTTFDPAATTSPTPTPVDPDGVDGEVDEGPGVPPTPDDGFDDGFDDSFDDTLDGFDDVLDDGPFGTTFSDDTTTGDDFGETTFGETTFGGTTFGDTTFGDTTFGDTTSGDDFGTTFIDPTFGETDFGTTVTGTTSDDDFGTTFGGTDFGTDGGTEGESACIEVDLGSATGLAVATGSNLGAGDDVAQPCAGTNGPEVVHAWTAPATTTWTFDTAGSGYDTALTLRSNCNLPAFACNDDDGPGLTSQIVVDLEAGDTVLIAVEGFSSSTGDFVLNIDGEGFEVDPLDAFESPQPFGDSVQELDLIGTWNLPTDGGSPGYSMSLTIAPDGTFVWEELDAMCGDVREGTGWLWVAGAQLVMLFDTYDGVAPWPVMDQFGWDAQPPFLLRAGYAPVLGHIAITAPPDLRVALPWASRGYARTVGGTTALDIWVAETELWAVAPGADAADIVARDRHTLDIIAGPTATRTFQRWWYENGVQMADPAVVDNPPYADDMVGNLVLDGEAFTYVGTRMASYEPGDNFQLDAPSTCP